MSFCVAEAAGSRVLYITTSAGYRHDSLETSAAVLKSIGDRTGLYNLVHTEDLSVVSADSLKQFDAVLFFTSGELPLDDTQRAALTGYVRNGGNFGGFHSATDTLYSWSDYGDLIGAYFDGHPWTQEARVLKSIDHLITAGLPSPWTLTEEYYQFRLISPFQTLLSLDTSSVDLGAPGVNASTFPLAWTKGYGSGRVFYTALGHFEGTWQNSNFQRLLENAMRWFLGSEVLAVGNAASMAPADTISPGSIISIYGRNLGSNLLIGGQAAKVLYASATQINAVVPQVTGTSATVSVSGAERVVRVQESTPGIFLATAVPGAVTVWMTGLGTGSDISATIAGRAGNVLFVGQAPEFPGLWQVNLEVPSDLPHGDTPITVAGARTHVVI